MIFSAKVINGEPRFIKKERDAMKAEYHRLEGKVVYLTISGVRPPRSLMQNAYYHSVVVQMIADEIGDTPLAVHESLKDQFLAEFWTKEQGREVKLPKSTTRLSTKEFKDYLDRIIAWAAAFHGIAIPEPQDLIHSLK